MSNPEVKEVKEIKETKEVKEVKGVKEPKDAKKAKAPKEVKKEPEWLIEETNNRGQFEHIKLDGKDNSVETIVGVYVSRDRFLNLKELHSELYEDDENFWKMFERDLFDTDK